MIKKINMLYCVTFGGIIKPYFGFIAPYTSVRDSETFSLTFCPPSVIDGIEKNLGCSGKIVRHKLTYFMGAMDKEFVKAIVYTKTNDLKQTIHLKHVLINPVLTLAFDNYSDANNAVLTSISFGQKEYLLCALPNSDDNTTKMKTNQDDYIQIINDDDFDLIPGVETFLTTEDDGIYVGNNRQRGNERMFIKIKRIEW